jgi:2-oxoglutarate ferredoxin oxidoreductase subunit beta
MTITKKIENLKPTDFASDQEVRWCPGCGDYAILKAVQRTLAEEGAQKENTVFVSGIGCSSRLPYYMSTYGFHTIHGRAPAFATGIKLTNPELDVWVITGDGDGLSIGGNHLMHALRRNVDFQILLFNNETYGLTKGQYSPTSRPGTRSPSSPSGSLDNPFLPCSLALGAGAKFVARGVDTAVKDLSVTFKRARSFPGTSFVEIFQNCIVYNDKVFAEFTDRDRTSDFQVMAIHGEPLLFGTEKNKGLRLNPQTVRLEVVNIGQNGLTEKDVLPHDETNPTLAALLAAMQPPEFPMAIGVLYSAPGETYEAKIYNQLASAKNGGADLNDVIRQGRTWHVDG